MRQYNSRGRYAGYDKNNKEREALDYYATPPKEVTNILNVLKLDLENKTILDPGCGGGHLIEGVLNYTNNIKIIGTDIKERTNPFNSKHNDVIYKYGKEYDYLSEEYPIKNVDYIIMNPPYSVIIPFTLHSLDIANKGVLMLARLQFLEGKERYEKIFQSYPPSDIYVYVDRIACYRNGDFSINPSSVQAYAWFYWDKEKLNDNTKIHFIRRA